MTSRALFVDFNSYFASVEQQVQPHLRGCPVAVVPVLADSTSCIAASYEAKAFGVKTGTRVSAARKMCPGLQIVESRPPLYVEYHHRLVEAVESCIPVTKVLSVDEMTCDLMGSERTRHGSTLLAQRIKQTIAQDVGAHLKCSIGIAPNSFLAKTATELEKPDGLVVIEPRDLPHCLHGLSLSDICGVGARIERRLFLQGIVTVEQLCAASRDRLHRVWGSIEGDRMHANLRGEIVQRPEVKRASLGHSHVLPPEERSEECARSTLCRLLQKAFARMRRLEYSSGAMQVNIKYLGKKYWSQKLRFSHTDDLGALVSKMLGLWSRRPQEADEFLAVGVVLGALRLTKNCTPSLFDDAETRRALYESVDGLNEDYGTMKVYLGGAHLARSTAASPIAFGYIPELVPEPGVRRRKKPPTLKH